MKEKPRITRIILGAIARAGYTVPEFSRITGLNYTTLTHNRFPDPASWKMFELSAVWRYAPLNEDEKKEFDGILLSGDLRTTKEGGRK